MVPTILLFIIWRGRILVEQIKFFKLKNINTMCYQFNFQIIKIIFMQIFLKYFFNFKIYIEFFTKI